MKYPVKFLLNDNNFKNVFINFKEPFEELNTTLEYCNKKKCFYTTLQLSDGLYQYEFIADGQNVPDLLRSPTGGLATIKIGASHNNGIIFDINRSFVKNNHLVLMMGIDTSMWQKATLHLQLLHGLHIIHGKSTFIEGSIEYHMFVLDIPKEDSIFAFFELTGHNSIQFYGENGLRENEWSVNPFEIEQHRSEPISPSDIIGIYYLSNPKSIADFEKHISYFEKFPVDHISGDIPEDSLLRKQFQYFSHIQNLPILSCLLREIFLEQEDFNPSLGLLGRFAYEYRQDLANIPFIFSDDFLSFWELTYKNYATAARAIGFQLLGSMTPEILFGEEIGLHKIGQERQMIWTKTKWNKDLYHLYQKLLKLRKKYSVLRQGRFRFVIQDCNLWGIERYMDGEDSIFIFANHSKDNVIVDLTTIMDFNGPIIELLSDHPIKRKKVCTIFGESFVAFKQNSSKNKKTILLEDDDE